jgi:hypothetical protein
MSLNEAIERRCDLTTRLIKALAHLSRPMAMAIIAAWIDLDHLEEVVKFQERTP